MPCACQLIYNDLLFIGARKAISAALLPDALQDHSCRLVESLCLWWCSQQGPLVEGEEQRHRGRPCCLPWHAASTAMRKSRTDDSSVTAPKQQYWNQQQQLTHCPHRWGLATVIPDTCDPLCVSTSLLLDALKRVVLCWQGNHEARTDYSCAVCLTHDFTGISTICVRSQTAVSCAAYAAAAQS